MDRKELIDSLIAIKTNYDQNTYTADETLRLMEELYPHPKSKATKMSLFKKELMILTKIPGYDNGYQYNMASRKNGDFPELLPKELNKLVLTKRQYKVIEKAHIKSLKAKMDNMIEIPDAKKFKKAILRGLKGDTYDELFPALLLASGRRTAELFLFRTTFKRGSNTHSAIFTGQVKGEKDNYEIPLLVSYRVFKTAFRKFRKLIGDNITNNTQLIQELYHKQNERIFRNLTKKYFKLTPHTFRAVYVAYAYHQARIVDNSTTKSLNGYAFDILGHSNLNNNQTYATIRLLENGVDINGTG